MWAEFRLTDLLESVLTEYMDPEDVVDAAEVGAVEGGPVLPFPELPFSESCEYMDAEDAKDVDEADLCGLPSPKSDLEGNFESNPGLREKVKDGH